MKDLYTHVTHAAEHPDDERRAVALAQAQEAWVEQATQWWKAQQGATEKPLVPKTLHRKKALQWLMSTQKQLNTVLGGGWELFKKLTGVNEAEWPCVSLQIDQGSDGFSAANFLQFRPS